FKNNFYTHTPLSPAACGGELGVFDGQNRA
ncbi:MAG: hypothetical protein ACI9LN_004167, partial [Saprospiraceae bacterium]